MSEWFHVILATTIFPPFILALLSGLLVLGRSQWLQERTVYRLAQTGLQISLFGSLALLVMRGNHGPLTIDYGHWILIGNYDIPVVFQIDTLAQVYSLLGALLTMLVAHFSRTYLHKEAGYARYFILLGIFGTSTQLVAWGGALDLVFAGWEAIGICSAMFIGYFHERREPVQSSLRAFATYRICDVGFLVAIVSIHELLGSTRISDLEAITSLPGSESNSIALMLMLAAFGKSAQLPFSTWLPRAMEGPTPASALFYGAMSIHIGLFLLLRIAPVLEAAQLARITGVVVGLATAVYAALVARTHTDAKGALAHATLAQIGLILAEICMGYTTLALYHLVGHASLRIWQYLRAPNTLAETHVFGHHASQQGWLAKRFPDTSLWLYGKALHRFRLDDNMDRLVAGVYVMAGWLRKVDDRICRLSGKQQDQQP